MVTYAQLVNMDMSKLTSAAETAGGLSSTLANRGEEVRMASAIPAGIWQGGDADAASGLLAGQPPMLFDASDIFRQSQATLQDLVDGLGKAKEHAQSAQSLVAGTGIIIRPDGTVETPTVPNRAEAQRNEELARRAIKIIAEALRMADSADQDASSRLTSSGASGDSDDDSDDGGGDDDDGGFMEWLNGDWRNNETLSGKPDANDPLRQQPLFDKWTEDEWEKNYGPLTIKSEHGDGDGLNFSMPWDGQNFGFGVSGDPKHSLSANLPEGNVGPVNVSGGGVELNDSMIPDIGWEADEDGKTKLIPKVGMPFVSVETPNVSVDLNAVAEGTSDAVGDVKDELGKIPGTPW